MLAVCAEPGVDDGDIKFKLTKNYTWPGAKLELGSMVGVTAA